MCPEQHWAEAKRLFEAAATLADDEREAYLRRESQGDEALLAEVQSLLAWEGKTEGFLDHAVFRVADLAPSFDAGGIGVGHALGAWRIVDVIGQGGMGVVYRAERADAAFRRHAAIKVVRRGSDLAQIIDHFRRERETLAALDHPNIARLMDGGTTPDGQPYFVMEYVDGVRVDRYCDDQRLSVERRLDVFLAICAGVEYAHQNLVVHRDIKPDNILVSREGIPKLLDFGVAKILSARAVHDADATTATTWLMTPDYASPEQVAGRAPVTTAADVYSLGVLLYVLLTGRRPYSLSGSSRADLEAQLEAAELVLPSVRAGDSGAGGRELAEARATTPRTLALAHRRLGDILAWGGDVAVGLMHAGQSDELFKTIAAAAGSNFDDRFQAGVADVKLGDLLGNPSFPNLGRREDAAARYRAALAAFRQLDEAVPGDQRVQRFLGISFERIGALHEDAQRWREAASAYDESFRIRAALAASVPFHTDIEHDLAIAYERVGNIRRMTGDLTGAAASYEGALARFERLVDADPSNANAIRSVAVGQEKLAQVFDATSRRGEAMALLREALATYRAMTAHDPGNALARCDEARVAEALGDLAWAFPRRTSAHASEACREWRAALDVHRALVADGITTCTGKDEEARVAEKAGRCR